MWARMVAHTSRGEGVSLVNELAILLTKKIETELIMLIHSEHGVDAERIKTHPTFYSIRHTILSTLEEYLIEFVQSHKISDYELKALNQDPKTYLEHKQKVAVHQLAETILKNTEVTCVDSYDDEWSRYREYINRLVVVKMNRISNEVEAAK